MGESSIETANQGGEKKKNQYRRRKRHGLSMGKHSTAGKGMALNWGSKSRQGIVFSHLFEREGGTLRVGSVRRVPVLPRGGSRETHLERDFVGKKKGISPQQRRRGGEESIFVRERGGMERQKRKVHLE